MPTNTNPEVHTQFGPPDPNDAPLNLAQLFQILNRTVSSEIIPPGVYKPYIIQNGDPDVDDQDKIWIDLDSQGRPVATKIYWPVSGTWRRIYNGMLGEVRAFNGAPGYGPPPAYFNAVGMGNAGLEYDGWHICNGKDGTPDFTDRFIVGAHMNKTDSKNDYDDGEWVSWVDGQSAKRVGGAKDFTLNENNTFQPASPGFLKVGTYEIEGATLTADETKWGAPSLMEENKNKNLTIDAGDRANETPEAVSILPPFVALGWIIFLGYSS